MNILDKFNQTINDIEGSLVNVLTGLSPWLAPLAPAAMTYSHMREFLLFPPWLSLALAALVEILGFGTVSTALQFWFYNRKNRAEVKRAPLEIVIGVFAFYLALILISNVIIDLAAAFGSPAQLQAAVIAVRAMLTLQTIPGALIVAVRTSHRDLIRELKREADERKRPQVSESLGKLSESLPTISENLPKHWRKILPTLSLEDLQELAALTPEAARRYAARHNVSERTLQNWRANARAELEALQWK